MKSKAVLEIVSRIGGGGKSASSRSRQSRAPQAREGSVQELSTLGQKLERLHRRMPLRFPSGPRGAGPFGAYYTRLKYNLSWDQSCRVGHFSDVVVSFEGNGSKLVFWRGLATYLDYRQPSRFSTQFSPELAIEMVRIVPGKGLTPTVAI